MTSASDNPFASLVVDTAPSYKRVADLIEEQIVAGHIAPGDLLPTEGDLATQLGVHRSTIRESIRSLENSGLVKRVGGKRLMVSVPDRRSVSWSTTRAMGMQKVSFLELWELQMELEPFSAALAAERIEQDIEEKMRLNLQSLESNLNDDAAVITLDIEFHRLIAMATRNKALMLSIEPIGSLLLSATVDLYRKVAPARHRLLEAHVAIAGAIAAGNPEESRTWMARHIRDFHRGYTVAGMDMNAPIEIASLPRR